MGSFVYLFIIVLYFSITAFLGYLGYKGTRNATDYLVGGRTIHPFVMAISYGATFISTSAIVGFGGAAGVYGMGLLWLTVLNIFAGIFIAFIFFGKRTRKMGANLEAHTFPELLAKRYKSRFIQGFSGLIIFLAMPLYSGVVLIGAASFIETSMKIPYDVSLLFFAAIVAIYVMMGGIKGVMYTDTFQGSVMFIGMVSLLVMTYHGLGGVTAAHAKLTSYGAKAIEVFGATGHQGWTNMPVFGSDMWWSLVSTIVMGVGIGVLAQPQLIVRFMTVKSNRELNRAVLVGGLFILMMTGVAFVVGALSNVYFLESPAFGKIALLASGKNTDSIIPLYINSFMPKWFGLVFMLTLLSAAMSTLSSQFLTMGTSLSRDFYELTVKDTGDRSLLINRIGVLIAILISTYLAYYLPLIGGIALIAKGTALFFGLCAAMFLPVYIFALYFPGLSKKAAIVSILTGFISSLFWLLFIFKDVSGKILLCRALFNVDSLLDGTVWAKIDPILIALPISMIITIIGYNLWKCDLEDAHLEKCFKGINAKLKPGKGISTSA